MNFNGVYRSRFFLYLFYCKYGVDRVGFALGGWINASDRRLKSNIQPIGNALSKISLLEGKNYVITTKTKDIEGNILEQTRPQFGLIAQDLELVFPEMVQEKALFSNADDETLYKTVDYIQLIPVLIEAIKELKIEIDDLNKQIEELKKAKE